VIRHAIDNAALNGPLNAVSPQPVTNAEMTKAIARAVHRPALFKVPKPALALVFGSEFARELLLVSQRVLPGQLRATGYKFSDPDLDGALHSILASESELTLHRAEPDPEPPA
jgi:NAD dependent epimerase/dehydratase family enzyme